MVPVTTFRLAGPSVRVTSGGSGIYLQMCILFGPNSTCCPFYLQMCRQIAP